MQFYVHMYTCVHAHMIGPVFTSGALPWYDEVTTEVEMLFYLKLYRWLEANGYIAIGGFIPVFVSSFIIRPAIQYVFSAKKPQNLTSVIQWTALNSVIFRLCHRWSHGMQLFEKF